MKSRNRRITEAAEKTAAAEKRIAASKARLVEHFDEFVRICDDDETNESPSKGKAEAPPKSTQPGK
jgi:hypothetical protein